MSDTLAQLQKNLQTLTPSHLEVIDDEQHHIEHRHEGAGHFTVTIVSPQFSQQSLVQRHRMVFAAVGDLMPTSIHALSIHAYTPEEFSH
jgi:BolA family transcriptional regulator, general stress-responsive regulator